MPQPAIRVQNLSKLYRLGDGQGGYRTLRETIMNTGGRLRRHFRRSAQPAPVSPDAESRDKGGRGLSASSPTARDIYHALRDVSLEIGAGEVVGVIGRNGAGKSTLLKILSRITEPSSGRIELRGRVGSLLEVGTGFHPELSGRENIFLNGAILGMTRAEIRRKFDDIVDFAELGPFLDTPVKRYSSGMYVKLAFSVAAHLEPEILIVDEVLAVGDVAFQRKCMQRMQDVGRQGRTVLLVSHNMASIEALCSRAVLLERGKVGMIDHVSAVICEYHKRLQEGHDSAEGVRTYFLPDGRPSAFRYATLIGEDGRSTAFLPLGGVFRLRLGLDVPHPIEHPTLGLGIDDTLGQRILSAHTPLKNNSIHSINGKCEVECTIPCFPLAPGSYWIKLGLAVNGNEVDWVNQALYFTVYNRDVFSDGRGFHKGICIAPSEWRLLEAEVTR